MSDRNNMLRSVVAHAATPAVGLMAEFKQLALEHSVASERFDATEAGQCEYAAVRAEWVAAADRYETFRVCLVHMPTTDPDVIAVKAAVVLERYAGDVSGAIKRHLEGGEADEEALCFSIVRDLALRFPVPPRWHVSKPLKPAKSDDVDPT